SLTSSRPQSRRSPTCVPRCRACACSWEDAPSRSLQIRPALAPTRTRPTEWMQPRAPRPGNMGDSISLDIMLSDDHPIPVMVVEGGVRPAMNAAMAALVGPSAVPGVDVGSLFDEDSRDKLARALANDVPSALELQGMRSTGGPLTIRFLVAP